MLGVCTSGAVQPAFIPGMMLTHLHIDHHPQVDTDIGENVQMTTDNKTQEADTFFS